MVAPLGVQRVWQLVLELSWPNRAQSPKHGQSVGTQRRRERRRFARGHDGGLGWAGVGKQSFVGGVLSAVRYTERRSHEYDVC